MSSRLLTFRSLHTSRSQQLRLIPSFQKFKLLEQPAGNIIGTVNDAYVPPMANYYEGGYHWTYERIITIGLVPLAMSPFIGGVEYPIIDSIFSVLVLFHSHAGLKACIIDYIQKRRYGIWHKMASGLLTLGTFTGMYGIYLLETDDNGLFDLLLKVWSA